MTQETTTFIIFAMGALTVFLSLWVAIVFRRQWHRMRGDGKVLGKAIYFQLLGEFIMAAGTLVFSVLAWQDVLKNVSVEVQSSLRFVMFFATAATTFFLHQVVTKLDQ